MNNSIKILSIEDSELDTELILAELRTAGIIVVGKRVDTEEAFRVALFEGTWDAILCDYVMPQFDALTALSVLRESELDIPFIIISGAVGEETIVALMKAGCHDCVQKNNLKRLPEVIAREMREATIRHENRDMKERLQKYAALMHYTKDIMIFQDEAGHILEVNDAAVAIYGYTKDELLKMSIDDLRRSKEKTHKFENKEAIRVVDVRIETEHYRKDGSILQVEVSAARMMEDGKAIVFNVLRDISERKLLEGALLAAKEKAERANEAKSHFLANMSHEIRTPMNAMIGMTEMVLMTELNDMQREFLEIVKSSTYALLGVLNDVLDYSKLESRNMFLAVRPFSLWDVVKEIHTLFLVSAVSKKITLNLNIDEKVPLIIKGDAGRIKQILSNLVGNAIKFTSFGSVSIEVTMEKKEDVQDWLSVSVKDTGIGISNMCQQNLFQSFYQVENSLERSYGGTGLGLSISKNIAEQMGGTITVQSCYGVGSEFVFSMPVVLDDVSMGSSECSLNLSESLIGQDKQYSVLVIENDENSRRVCELILGKMGIGVEIATNGEDGVEKALSTPYDLILMDIGMGAMDGYQATAQIRLREKNHTPIIALTAYALAGDREKCLMAGMDDYLSKPVDLKSMATLLLKWLKKTDEA